MLIFNFFEVHFQFFFFRVSFFLSFIYDIQLTLNMLHAEHIPSIINSYHFLADIQNMAQTLFNNDNLVAASAFTSVPYPDVIYPQLGEPKFVALISGVNKVFAIFLQPIYFFFFG